MPTKKCPSCDKQFEYEEDPCDLFEMGPDTCGQPACVQLRDEQQRKQWEERLKKEKEDEWQRLREQALKESQVEIPWAGDSGRVVEWTHEDRRAAQAIGSAAIEVCAACELDVLIFLGESLAPIKHFVREKQGATVVRKVSGSFSGISISEIDLRELEAWFAYVARKLPAPPMAPRKMKVGFVDYSASGKTFMSLGRALVEAPWARCCEFVFIPVVKLGSQLPGAIRDNLMPVMTSAVVSFSVVPLVPKVYYEYACDTLLANEKMKQILGRRSRRLNLRLWDDELRKRGMSSGMPEGWRKATSLLMLDDQSVDVLKFPLQPTFEDTETAKKRAQS